MISETVSSSFSHSDVSLCVYSVLTVDGNWGEWSSWSECLCPDMKVNRTRYCDNLPPKNDGEDCPGIGWEEGDCYMPCGKLYTIRITIQLLRNYFNTK